jgi:hypothetical protein
VKLSLDPEVGLPLHVSAVAEALSEWYDARPEIRRLWAIRSKLALNIIVTLEPTVDNNDTYPAWFAHSRGWASEIQSMTGGTVSLELLEEPSVREFEVEFEGEIVAAISWRDPTSFWKAD